MYNMRINNYQKITYYVSTVLKAIYPGHQFEIKSTSNFVVYLNSISHPDLIVRVRVLNDFDLDSVPKKYNDLFLNLIPSPIDDQASTIYSDIEEIKTLEADEEE